MSYYAKAGVFAADTTKTVGQTQTISGVGFTPKLVLFWWTGNTTSPDNAESANIQSGFGASDAGASGVEIGTYYWSTDNVADSAAFSSQSINYCVYNPTSGSGQNGGRANVDSFNSDGFVLYIQTQFTAAIQIDYLAIGGDDITNVYIGSNPMPTTTGEYDVTEVGFQPDAVIFTGGQSSLSSGTNSALHHMFGMATSASCQGTICNLSVNAAATSNTQAYGYNGECMATRISGTSPQERESFVQFLSNGFRLNHLEGSSARYYHYVCIKGGKYFVGDLTTRTDTNDITETFGFRPKAILFASAMRALSTQNVSTDHNRFTLGAASSASTVVAQAWSDEDNLADTEVARANYNSGVYTYLADDAVTGVMDVKSFDSTGFTAVMNDADASANWVTYLAIGSTTEETTSLTVNDAAQAHTAGKPSITTNKTIAVTQNATMVQASDNISLSFGATGEYYTKVGYFDIDTAKTAGQDQAVTGIGFKPKALILWASGRTGASEGVVGETIHNVIGFATSGSNRYCLGTVSQDAATTTVAYRIHSTQSCIYAITTGGVVEGILDFKQFDNDGFTFTIDNQFDNAYKVSYLALGGSDLTAAVSGSILMANSTGNQSFTDPGFKPDAMLFLGSGLAKDSINSYDRMFLGMTSGSNNVGVVAVCSQSSEDPTQTRGYGYNNEVTALANSTAVTMRSQLYSFDTNGFTLNVLESAPDYIFYLALKGGQYFVGDLTTRTDTNDISETVGFQPKAILFASANRALSTQDTSTAHNRMSIGAATSTSERSVQAWSDESALADTETASAYYESAVYAKVADDAIVALMDLKSIDYSGFTCVMDDTDDGTNWVTYLAIGSPKLYTLSVNNASHIQEVTPGAFPNVPVTDNFNRASLGSDWIIDSGTPSISGSMASVSWAVMHWKDSYTAGMEFYFTVKNLFADPIFSHTYTDYMNRTSPNQRYRLNASFLTNAGINMTIQKEVSGEGLNNIYSITTHSISSSEAKLGVRHTASGEISLYINHTGTWELVGSTVDSSVIGVGTWRIEGNGDYAGDAWIDDFAIGTLNLYLTQHQALVVNNAQQAQTSSEISFVKLRENGARYFNGSTNRIDFPSIGDMAGHAITIAAWIYSEGWATPADYIIQLHPSGNTDYSVQLQLNDVDGFLFLRHGSTNLWREGTLSAGKTWTKRWYHILATHTGTFTDYTTVNCYINGVLSNDAYNYSNGVGTETNSSGSVSIGGRIFDNNRNFDGKIGEVAVWDRVLSSDEITQITTPISAGYYHSALEIGSGLIFCLHPDEPKDFISGVTGTLSGTSLNYGPDLHYYELIVNNATQTQNADNIILSSHYILALVNDVAHTQTSQKINPDYFPVLTGNYYAKVGSFNIDITKTVSQTQSVHVGFQPKIVLFWWGGGTSTSDEVAGGTISPGFGAGISSASRCTVGMASTDAAGTSDTVRNISTTECIRVYSAGNTTSIDGIMDFSSMDSNGFTLIVDDQFTQPYRIDYLALGGTDLTNVHIGTKQMPTVTGNFETTGVGFKPDAIITGFAVSAISTSIAYAYMVLGMATGASNQGYTMAYSADAGTTSVTRGYGYNGEITGGGTNERCTFVSMDNDGFTLNKLEGAGAHQFWFIALKGGQYSVGDITTRTDGNDISETVGFQPVALLFNSANRALSTQDVVTNQARMSIGGATSTNGRACMAFSDENGLEDTETAYANYDTAVYAQVVDDATVGLMDLKSIDSNGFTCVMDDTDPTACWVTYLAIGETPEYTLTVQDVTQTQNSDNIILSAHYTLTTVNTATQLQNCGNVVLTQHQLLAVNTATQLQKVGMGTVTDNFNRANGNLGSNWNTMATTASPVISNSQVIVGSDGTLNSAYYIAKSFSNNQWAQAKFPSIYQNSTAYGPAVGIRFSDSRGYFLWYGNSPNRFSLWRMDSNIGADWHEIAASDSLTIDPTDILKIAVSGSTITGYQNGNQILTAFDATYSDGYPGVWLYYSQEKIDDWSAGDLELLEDILLTQIPRLAVQDAAQAQTSEKPTLTYHSGTVTLTVNNAEQLQNSGNVALTQHHVLVVNTATQLQNSDNVALSQHYLLVVNTATQLQTSDKITLTYSALLVISNSEQLQTSGNVILNPYNPTYPSGPYTIGNFGRIPAPGSTTVTSNPASGSFLPGATATVMVAMLAYAGTTARGGGAPTFSGSPLTQADTQRYGATSGEASAELWYLLLTPPTSGSWLSVPNSGGLAISIDIASANATTGYISVLNATAGSANTGATTNPYVPITTTAGSTVIFSNVANGAQNWSPSAQSGSAIYNTDNGAWGEGSQYDLKPTSDTYTQSWTFSTGEDWGVVAAAFGQTLSGIYPIHSTQLQTADNVELTVHAGAPLTVNNCAQAQTADNVTLTQHYSITVNGTAQAQTADNVVLTQHYVLTVNTATQLQNSDKVTLSAHYTLTTVNTATQLQYTNFFTFTDGYGGDVNTAKDVLLTGGAPDWNYGAAVFLWAWSSGMVSLLKFDLSSIDVSATCISATLTMYATSDGDSNSGTVTVYSISSANREWIEGTGLGQIITGAPSYSYRIYNTASWAGSEGLQTSGTDYETPAMGSATINNNNIDGTSHPISLSTSRVKDWFGSDTNNYGIVVMSVLSYYWHSSDSSSTAYRPKLVVQYIAPLSLSQKYSLTVQNSSQLQTSDNVALTQHRVLSVNNAVQAQTADNVVLTQHYVLTVNGATQLQNSDNVALTQHHVLTVQNIQQLMTSDNVTIGLHYALTVNNAQQLQSSENVILSAHYAITVNTATQLQNSDNVALTQHQVLAVNTASQLQNSDNVALTQHYVLVVNIATQLQTADNVIVTSPYLLVVSEAIQLQNCGNIILTPYSPTYPPGPYTIGNFGRIPPPGSTTVTSNPASGSFLAGTGATVMVLMIAYAGTTARGGGSPTFSGSSLTQADTQRYGATSGEASVELWYLLNPSAGSWVSVPNSGGLAMSVDIASANATYGYISTLNATAGSANTGATTNPYVPITTTAGSTIIFSNVANGAQNWSPSAQSGSIIYNTDNGAWGEGSQYDLKATSGTYTQSWTFGTGEDWGTLAVAFGQLLAGLSRVNNAEQLQTSDNVILTAHAGAPLTLNNSVHVQTSENVVLIQHYSITVNNAVQAQIADNVVLSAHYAIVSQNATQLQTSDNVVLTQHQVLVVNTATQLQNSGNVVLTQHQVLAVNIATQLQTSDNVALTQHQILVVNTATQLQTSDNVALTQHQVLTVNTATQYQSSLTSQWWLASGIKPSQTVVAYQPESALSYANSKINLANQGFDDAIEGVSPDWDSINGWKFNPTGSENNYLLTTKILSVDYSGFIKFTNRTRNIAEVLCGIYSSSGRALEIWQDDPSGYIGYGMGGTDYLNVANTITQGNLGISGKTAYRNGISDGTIPVGSTVYSNQKVPIAALFIDSSLAGYYCKVNVQAFVIYNTTLTSTQALAVYEAMSVLGAKEITLNAHYSITANNAQQLQTSDNVVLNAHYAITVNNAQQLQTSDNVALSAHYAITVNNAQQLQTSDNVVLTQHQVLAVNTATQLQTSDNVILTQHQILVVNTATQLQTSDKITLIYAGFFNIAVNTATQSQTSENVSLTQHQILAVNTATQLQTTDNVVLTQHQVLVVNTSTQLQTSDNVVLTQHQALVVNTATQLQTSDNVVLTQHQLLVVNTSTQLQTADNVVLTQHQVLVINTATQLQNSDNIALTQHQVLVVNTATQLQSANNITLSYAGFYSITVNDATQLQTADNVALTQHYTLFVNDATQIQASDNVSLTQHYILTLNNAAHVQTSENVTLTQHHVLVVNNATQIQISDVSTYVTLVSDTFSREDGALGYTESYPKLAWTGSTWNISGGSAINTTTTGNELLTNSSFENGNPPNNWVSNGAPFIFERSDVQKQDGSYSLHISGSNMYPGFLQSSILTSGSWYKTTGYIYPISDGNFYFLNNRTENLYLYLTVGAWNKITYINISSSNNFSCVRVYGNEDYYDNFSVKSLSPSEFLSTVDINKKDVIVEASITLESSILDRTPVGVALRVDDSENPQNYIYCWIDGYGVNNWGIARICKVVNGVITFVSERGLYYVGTMYSPGKKLQARIRGNTVLLYYDDIYCCSATITDAEIINNTIHGLFSTYEGNKIDNFIVKDYSGTLLLTQHQSISVNDSSHQHTSENVALNAHYSLSLVNDATQAQTSDNVSLTSHYSLTVNDSTHAQITVEIAVSLTDYILTGQYFGKFGIPLDYFPYELSRHLTLVYHSGVTGLTVNDSTHLQTSDNVALTQHQILSINDAIHGQTSENVILTQHQMLAINNASQAQTSDNVVLTQHQVLAVNNAIQVQTSDNIVLTQHQVLVVNNTVHVQTSENIILIQHQVLVVNNAIQAQTSENISLTQHQVLAINDAIQAQTSENVILTAHYAITINNATQAQISDNVVLIQHQILVVNNAEQLQTSDNVVLSAHYTITVNNAIQAQTSDNITLTQHQILVVNNGIQIQTSENVNLSAHYSITVNGATQTQTSETVTLTQHQVLVINDAIHTQTSDNVVLSAHYSITVNDSVQAQTSDNVVLTQHQVLIINDTIHVHISENVILTQHQVLTVQDAVQTHTSENVNLTQHMYGMLVIQDSTQLQTSENIVLTQHYALTVNDSIHVQTSDNVALLAHYSLTVNDATQNQSSDNVILTQHYTLAVNDASQIQTSESVALFAHYSLSVNDAIQIQTSDNVILTQHQALTINDSTQAQTSENVNLSAHYTIVVNDATQFQTSENVILTQHYALVISDATQAQTSDNVILIQHHILTIDDATQAQTSENVVLVAHMYGLLVIQNATQAQTSENVTLTARVPHFVLVIIGSYESLLLENTAYLLQENDGKIALDDSSAKIILRHTAENVILSAHYSITVNNATQSQTSDNILLTQHHVLVVNNTTHSQSANNLLSNLIAYWAGNETSGSLLDHHINSLNMISNAGSAVGIVYPTTRDYNWQDSYLEDNEYLSIGDNDFTIVAWYKFISLVGPSQLFGKQYSDFTSNNKEYWVFGITGQTLYFQVSSDGTDVSTVSSSEGTGYDWNMVAVWHDSINNTINIQINNRTVYSGSHVGGIYDGSRRFGIGADGTGHNWFIGNSGPTIFWKSAPGLGGVLTSDQRTQLYRNGTGLTYYNLDINLTQHQILVVNNITQSQTSNNVILSAHYSISVNDATQLQTSENVNLFAHYAITVNDATHVQTSDNVNLFAHYSLTVNDAIQLQTSENVILSAHYAITVNDAIHAQTSENVILIQHQALTVENATQAQTSENVVLTQHHVLEITDTNHTQTAENVELIQHMYGFLVIQYATHAQTSDNVELVQHHILIVDDSSQVQTADNIYVGLVQTITVNDAVQGQFTYEVAVILTDYILTNQYFGFFGMPGLYFPLELSRHLTLIYHPAISELSVQNATQLQTSDNVELTQHQVLTIDDSTQIQSSENVILTAHYAVTVNDAIQTQTSDNVILTQHQLLFVDNSSHVQTSDNVILLAHYSITVSDAVHGQFADSISLIQHYALVVNDAVQSLTSENVILSAHYSVVTNDATQAQTVDTVVLTQHQILSIQDAIQLQTSENVVLSAHYAITVKYVIQTQTSDNVELTQHYALTINDSIHLQTSENITLLAHYSLSVDNATQAQSSDNITLAQHYILVIENAEQLQTADNIDLIQHMLGYLAVDNSAHAQTADNVILTQHQILSIYDASQLITSDNVILTQRQTLSVQDAVHLQTADNINIIQGYLLVVQNSEQVQTSDNVILSAHYTITVNDSSQTQTADNIELFAHYSITVNDSNHVQITDSVILIQHYIIFVQDVIHLQTSNNVDLIQHYVLVISDVVQLQTADNVTLIQHYTLDIQNSTQLQTAETVNTIQHYVITINDATQEQFTYEVVVIISDYILTNQYFGYFGIPGLYFPLELSKHLTLIYHPPTAAITVQDASQLQTSENVELVVHIAGLLSIQNATQKQTSDNVVLTQHYVLTVNDSYQLQTSDNINIAGHYILTTVDNSIHTQVVESVALSAYYSIAVNDSTQAQTSDNTILTQHHVLFVNNAIHAQTSENVALLAHYTITVNDANHLQTSEEVLLVFHNVLVVQDAIHAETSENVELTQHYILSVLDSIHIHIAENVNTTGHYAIPAVNDSTHLQTSDNIELTAHYGVIVNDSTHTQTSENVELTQHHVFGINDAIHVQTSENIDLVQHHILAVDDSTHKQTATTIKLIYFVVMPIPGDRLYIIEPENRIFIIEHENRTLYIESENRVCVAEAEEIFLITPEGITFSIEPENRAYIIEPENRIYVIEKEDRKEEPTEHYVYIIEIENRIYTITWENRVLYIKS